MRIFTVSDLHVDYPENLHWVNALSYHDYRDDLLILGGDISDVTALFESVIQSLVRKFRHVMFVPGNHDLWVHRDKAPHSIRKFELITKMVQDHGVLTSTAVFDQLVIYPLLSWYDYSFGLPSEQLMESWSDYYACKWPEGSDEKSATDYFHTVNDQLPKADTHGKTIISFSHFLPRLDILPSYLAQNYGYLFPVFGSSGIETQLRQLGSNIHIYGHSHLNLHEWRDDVQYINNAFGYPKESRITRKALLQIEWSKHATNPPDITT